MKKLITSVVSLALAGSMALGLAACDKTKGESALLKCIDGTLSAKNYDMSVESGLDAAFYYNGELLTADTVITTADGEIKGSELFLNFGIIQNIEEFKNPLYVSMQDNLLECDYEGGKVSWIEVYNGEMEKRYFEVDGTTLNVYYEDQEYDWSDFENPVVTSFPAKISYTNFKSNAQAKALLRENMAQSVEGVTLDTILEAEVKGTGKNSSRKGTIKELCDLFKFDASTDTYSAIVDASELGGPAYAHCAIDIVARNGHVSSLTMTVPGNEYVEGMPEGITADVTMVAKTQYYNYGSSNVSIPADVKNVSADHVREMPILTSAETWKTLLEDYGTAEFKLSYQTKEEVDGVASSVYTNIYVDTEANAAVVEVMNYTTNTSSFTYYKVANGKLLTYVGHSNYGFVTGYDEPTEKPIEGDATAALIAVLPVVAQDYYAGFSGGALKEQFAKFELTSVTNYTASLKLNGKNVKVVVRYDYYESEYSIDGVYVYYDECAVDIIPHAKGELNDYSPDNY